MSLGVKDGINLVRRHQLLRNWSDAQIAVSIFKAIKGYAFSYYHDAHGKLAGICFGRWESPEHIHIVGIVGSLKVFVKFLKTNHPQCTKVTGYRYGKIITYKRFYGR